MINAYKKGDQRKCDPGKTNEEIELYCNSSFTEDLDLIMDCKIP
jgi:hypothetical protein